MESKIAKLVCQLADVWRRVRSYERAIVKADTEMMRAIGGLANAFDLPPELRPATDERTLSILSLEAEILAALPCSPADRLAQAVIGADRLIAPMGLRCDEPVENDVAMVAMVKAMDAAAELVRQLELAGGTTRKKLGLAIYVCSRDDAVAAGSKLAKLVAQDTAGGVQ